MREHTIYFEIKAKELAPSWKVIWFSADYQQELLSLGVNSENTSEESTNFELIGIVQTSNISRKQ